MTNDCRISSLPIDVGALIAAVANEACGAIAAFVGTARDSSSARPGAIVRHLEYEAYAPMAERVLSDIAGEIVSDFGARRVTVVHRIGRLEPGEVAVVIVVATPHRAQAFDGCRYLIEQLKLRVPIWKKEVFADGAEWINARP